MPLRQDREDALPQGKDYRWQIMTIVICFNIHSKSYKILHPDIMMILIGSALTSQPGCVPCRRLHGDTPPATSG